MELLSENSQLLILELRISIAYCIRLLVNSVIVIGHLNEATF